MKFPKPLLAAAAVACSSLLEAERALADAGERTPVRLSQSPAGHVGGTGSGTLVRTFVGLAVVIAVIYGLYWVLKQVRSSREEKPSGSGLSSLATLPLGTGRSLHVVRAGREVVLLGVSEHGVTPIRTYSDGEAEEIGLLGGDDVGGASASTPTGGLSAVVDELRRRTVRR